MEDLRFVRKKKKLDCSVFQYNRIKFILIKNTNVYENANWIYKFSKRVILENDVKMPILSTNPRNLGIKQFTGKNQPSILVKKSQEETF